MVAQDLAVEEAHHRLDLFVAEDFADPAGEEDAVEAFELQLDVFAVVAGHFEEHEEDRQLHQDAGGGVAALVEDVFGDPQVPQKLEDVFVVAGAVDEAFAGFVDPELLEDHPVVGALGDEVVAHQVAAVVDVGGGAADVDEEVGVGDLQQAVEPGEGAVDHVGGGA